ncbi:hypothetical protein ACJVC5_13590 [Peredibacter sp. HCB2-198]|uniref:hypothetical protein n=1 Tax=Peredibacter sp. HCB2-198 TaxID=3383025 RepID=UPI0038B68978
MKNVLLLIGLFSFMVFAGTPGYELTFEVQGKEIAKTQGKIRIKEGQMGSLSYAGTEIEVRGKEGEIQGHKGIMLDFVLKKDQKIISRPQLLVEEKKQAEFSQSGELTLKVTATRINF